MKNEFRGIDIIEFESVTSLNEEFEYPDYINILEIQYSHWIEVYEISQSIYINKSIKMYQIFFLIELWIKIKLVKFKVQSELIFDVNQVCLYMKNINHNVEVYLAEVIRKGLYKNSEKYIIEYFQDTISNFKMHFIDSNNIKYPDLRYNLSTTGVVANDSTIDEEVFKQFCTIARQSEALIYGERRKTSE